MGERPIPDAPHPGKGRPQPPGTLLPPHSAQSQRTTAHVVELVTAPHARCPRTHDPWVVGPGRTPQGRLFRRGRALNPRRPTRRQGVPPPGGLVLVPKRAQSARKSSTAGFVPGHHAGTPRTHSQWVAGPGRTPQGRAVRRRRASNPGSTHAGRRHPPGLRCAAPTCAQSQLPRARAVGLVTGPHAHGARSHSQWVEGPDRMHQGRAVGRSRAPNPGRPTRRQEAPPRALSCRPHCAQSQLPRARAVGLVTGPRAHTPRTHIEWVVGPGGTLQGRAVGRGRAPDPRCLTRRQEVPSPGALVPPPQRAKSARKSARCGVGDGSLRPHHPHQQPVGSGPQPHAPRTGGPAWEIAQLRTPHTQAGGAPSGLPRAAPTARKASSQERALWGW